MAELPATQQMPNVPVIFYNDDGHPLCVFVEACGIVHRPKLVRTLKKAGAEICNDPRQAQIILVDSRTYEGRKFIRDWGNDVNRVVLEYSWVSKSLAAGKALKESDQWGNCLTQDDGLPLDFDDELTNKSPLPTPRITPVETVVPSKAAERPRLPTAIAAQSSKAANSIAQNHESVYTPQQSTESPTSFGFAPVSSSAQNNGLQFPVTDAQIPIQQLAPGFLPPIHPYQPGVPAQFMQQPIQPGMMPMTQLTQLQIWAHMMGSMLSQGTSQLNSDPFAMSLIDSLRTHGMVPYSMPQPQEGHSTQPDSGTLEAPGFTQQPTPAPPPPPLEDDMITTPRSPTPPPASSVSHKAKTSTTRHPPQIGRRSAHRTKSYSPLEPSSSSASQVKKQKRKEKSPEGRRKTIAYIGPTRPLYNSESPTKAPQENQSQKVFVNEKGKAMSFFVQVDQPHRLNVVTSIKKNGGKISNTQTTADYAILHSHSKTFMDLLTSTVEAGKTAVSPAFIHDSVKEGALPDPTQYKFRLPGKATRKAARYYSSDIEELSATEAAPKRKLAQNQGRQEKRRRAKQESEVLSANFVKLEPEEVQLVFEKPSVPSPTPPPAHTQQSTSKGFKYPDIERDYALKYMKILLQRNHQMSTQAMAERLYRKLPHHSLNSWRSYISSVNMRDEVEKLRKKAASVYRKSLQPKEEPHDVVMNGVELDNSSVNMEEARKKDEENDLDVICNFFAFGGGDGQADNGDQDALWARLSSKATCKTANSWAVFYDRHYPVIQERYAGLVGPPAQPDPTANDMNF